MHEQEPNPLQGPEAQMPHKGRLGKVTTWLLRRSTIPDIEGMRSRQNIRGLQRALDHQDDSIKLAAAEALLSEWRRVERLSWSEWGRPHDFDPNRVYRVLVPIAFTNSDIDHRKSAASLLFPRDIFDERLLGRIDDMKQVIPSEVPVHNEEVLSVLAGKLQERGMWYSGRRAISQYLVENQWQPADKFQQAFLAGSLGDWDRVFRLGKAAVPALNTIVYKAMDQDSLEAMLLSIRRLHTKPLARVAPVIRWSLETNGGTIMQTGAEILVALANSKNLSSLKAAIIQVAKGEPAPKEFCTRLAGIIAKIVSAADSLVDHAELSPELSIIWHPEEAHTETHKEVDAQGYWSSYSSSSYEAPMSAYIYYVEETVVDRPAWVEVVARDTSDSETAK